MTFDLPARLRPFLPALLLGILTLLFSFGVGASFGAAEDSLKKALQQRADAVLATAYEGDAAKAKPVVEKSWSYLKRAHLHGGGLGASALVLILLLALAVGPTVPARIAATAMGAGGLGYSLFWLAAGFAAPALGSTGAAKESLAWLAIPSSGAMGLGTLATFVLVALALGRRPAA
jgi:hypothetical protein